MAEEEKPAEKSSEKKRNTVYLLTRASRCHHCDKKLVRGDLVKLENKDDDREALCKTCAQLESFVLVLKGKGQVTRLATKYSKMSYVVLQWDETWKSYNRVGILAEPEAVARAEKETA
ncbi:MAG: hypothetical protein HYX67_00745 [Candidatus Melainabacteria bacterium]|nr:hypothetical protein [Candidatus Melainabacteria bacterium]